MFVKRASHIIGEPKQGLAASQSSLDTSAEARLEAARAGSRPLCHPKEREMVEGLSVPV